MASARKYSRSIFPPPPPPPPPPEKVGGVKGKKVFLGVGLGSVGSVAIHSSRGVRRDGEAFFLTGTSFPQNAG